MRINPLSFAAGIIIFLVTSWGIVCADGPPPLPPLPQTAFFRFDETNFLSGAGNLPIENTNLSLIESWQSNALLLDAFSPAILRYRMEDGGRANFTLTNGSVLFWFSPSWSSTNIAGGTGPGQFGRLLEVGIATTNSATGFWSLFLDPPGTGIYFSGGTNGAATNYLSAAISWESNTWHHVALSFSRTNSLLYLDGELVVTNGLGVTLWPNANELTNGFTVGSDRFGLNQARGAFELLRTADYRYSSIQMENSFTSTRAEIDNWEGILMESQFASMPLLEDPPAVSCVTNGPLVLTNIACAFESGAGWVFSFEIAGTNASYDVFSTTNLLANAITNSTWVYLGEGEPCARYSVTNQSTNQTFYIAATQQDSDGDSLTDAYERLVSHTDSNSPDNPTILFQPLSQTIDRGDTVTFAVGASGHAPFRYQWMFNGTNIVGGTNNSLIIPAAQYLQAGDYSVHITNSLGLATVSSNATLTIVSPENWPVVTLTGARQGYTFKNGITYYIPSRVELYGTTTIEGGTIIKPDSYNANSTLAIMGNLVCQTDDLYLPAFLTSVDDDTLGDVLEFSLGIPTALSNGAPYLDLTYAQDSAPELSNLRIRFADQGILTPESKTVHVWNSQFLECNSSVVASESAKVDLHNVLFAGCGSAVAGVTNFSSINAEHVTAAVTDFWSQSAPSEINLTNSVVVGALGSGPAVVTDHTALNPASPVFEQVNAGQFYLTNSSSYRNAGATNISFRLAKDLQKRSTQAPQAMPPMIGVAGDMTFGPKAARYTNGAPDYGYYYPAIDWTVGWITNRGNIAILPGTVLGFRNEFSPKHDRYTWWGFNLREGSTFVSHGTPTQPNIFTDVQMVQEQLVAPVQALFVPDFWPISLPNDTAPSLDIRFSKFYVSSKFFHIWSGYDASYDYLSSLDSLVDLTIRDCEFYGGRLTLGEPDYGEWYGAPVDFEYGDCKVSLINNLFDNVTITLSPTFYPYGGATNVMMELESRNNLFRNGLWFRLEPIPLSTGPWVFKDNFFEKTDLIQNTNSPIDFNFNGYSMLSSNELAWLYFYYPWVLPNSGRLLTTTNGGGGNEVFLTTAPSYQAGPLGKFYLPTIALQNAGSGSAAEIGLFHYTTSTNQVKKGTNQCDIGLHYVASVNATSSLPKDSDSDGIPDFVENRHGDGDYENHAGDETDWEDDETETGIADAHNVKYDDVDLDGDGLAGRMEQLFGTDPLVATNALKLIPVTTGGEPGIVTFEVPISYDTVTNEGGLSLHMNGIPVSLDECTRATNGNCLLSFNVAFDPQGLHYLSAAFRYGSAPGKENPITLAMGELKPFYSSNCVQFFEMGSMFDDTSLYLDAKAFIDQTDYTIELYDPSTSPPTLLNTITNSTSNGFIDEEWDLLLAGSTNSYTGAKVEAVFSLTAASTNNPSATNKTKKTITRADGSLSEWGPNFNFVYFRTPTNDAWAADFAKDGTIWDRLQGVVDTLIKPAWTYEVYNSYFNRFMPDPSGEYPGYITKRSRATNDPASLPTVLDTLLPDLTNGFTKQIYIYGHGNNGVMKNYNETAHITSRDVGSRLKNTFATKGGLTAQNPYRFVWLDGCATASGKEWRRAFGIFPLNAPAQAKKNKTGPQAYVGWEKDHSGRLNYSQRNTGTVNAVNGYAQTLSTFFALWMNDVPLKQCLDTISEPAVNRMPIPVEKNKNFTVTLNGTTYTVTNGSTSKLYIIGYPGLRVDGVDTSLNSGRTYAAPENVE